MVRIWHWSLLLLPLLYWFVHLARNSKAPLATDRRYIALVLRLVVVLLLIAALGPWLYRLTNYDLCVVFLLDRSLSVSQEHLHVQTQQLKDALARMGPGDRAALISFGEAPGVEYPPMKNPSLDDVHVQVGRSATNLNQALQAALAMFPPHTARRIVLVSDGNETQGRARDIVPLLKQRKVQVYACPVSRGGEREVLLRDLILPAKVYQDEEFDVEIPVESLAAGTGTLRLYRNRELIGQRAVEIKPGKQVIRLGQKLTDKGFFGYEAHIQCGADTLYENNVARGFTLVEGQPKVLLVEETPSMLAHVFEHHGIKYDRIPPHSVPGNMGEMLRYVAVVFNNVPGTLLSQDQMNLVLAYVRDFGGGFMMTGGPSSFGAGGYLKTPVEEALPVTMDIKARMKMPPLAICAVVDKSGSMGGTVEGGKNLTKLDLAKEACIETVKMLYEKDMFGVVGFDDQGEWVQPLVPVQNKLAMIDQIGMLREGGGTFLLPGMTLAYDALNKITASSKHCIIMSDGLTSPGAHETTAKKMSADGITISSIALGRDADLPFMQNLAKIGNGRFYFTEDANALPRIFLQEALMATKKVVNEETFTPKLVEIGAILRGVPLTAVPQLHGFVETTDKDRATVHLVNPEGSPVLASWRKGVGKSVAFTTDVYGKWTKDWAGWEGMSQILGQATRFLLTDTLTHRLVASMQRDGSRIKLRIESFDAKGDLVNLADTRFSAALPNGKALSDQPMQQVGPGEYEAVINADQDGAYFFHITQQNDKHEVTAHTNTGMAISYSPEYSELAPNSTLLEEIASDTGGRIIASAKDAGTVFSHDRLDTYDELPIWPWLLQAAAIFFVLDIAVRRVAVGREDVQRFWRWLRPPQTSADTAAEASGLGHLLKVKIPRNAPATPGSPAGARPASTPGATGPGARNGDAAAPAADPAMAANPPAAASDGGSSLRGLKDRIRAGGPGPSTSPVTGPAKPTTQPAAAPAKPAAAPATPAPKAKPPAAPSPDTGGDTTSRLLAAKKRTKK